MSLFCTAIFLFHLSGSSSEYLPPLKEILDNAQFREMLLYLGPCRSHLYVCAYGLAQCVERARGPSDPPSETVLKKTVDRWKSNAEDELCNKSLGECKKKYSACDPTAPDPEKVVEAANKKHANDPANKDASSNENQAPLKDEHDDPVRDLLKHVDVDPAWDFDRQMPYRAQKVDPESDPRLMEFRGTREWRRRPDVWATYLANALPFLVIWLVVVLLRRSVRSFNIKFPRKVVKLVGF